MKSQRANVRQSFSPLGWGVRVRILTCTCVSQHEPGSSEIVTDAGGTHPTGMHACSQVNLVTYIFKEPFLPQNLQKYLYVSLNVKKLSKRNWIIVLKLIWHINLFQSIFESSCWLCCYVEAHSHSQHGSPVVLYTGNEQPVTGG